MPAGLADVLSSAQNIAQGLSGVAQTLINLAGAQNVAAISTTTLVLNGTGRVCVVSVTDAGSATGMIYDANNVTDTSRPIWTIAVSVGSQFVNLPVGYGIVVVPGTGQVLTVSYSTQQR